jgi:hypothetical protein
MRTVLRYENGRTIWSESTPASTGSSRLGGELVIGAPGPWEQNRIKARATAALRLSTGFPQSANARAHSLSEFADKPLGKVSETPENQVCQASEPSEVSL